MQKVAPCVRQVSVDFGGGGFFFDFIIIEEKHIGLKECGRVWLDHQHRHDNGNKTEGFLEKVGETRKKQEKKSLLPARYQFSFLFVCKDTLLTQYYRQQQERQARDMPF